MSDMMNINGRAVGDGAPAYIIAEMSANHAGSMERALELIHVAKDAGADCVKIQTYTADTMTIDCHNSYFQIEKGTWEGENLYGLYQKAYTPWEWQDKLRDEAAKVGIDFLSTPFDRTSVDFLEKLGVHFYKVASFELVDIPLLEYIASKNKPIIMSTGMGTLEEIDEAVAAIYGTGNRQLALMKCSSAYPAKSEEMNLRTICVMKKRLSAARLKIRMRHFRWNRTSSTIWCSRCAKWKRRWERSATGYQGRRNRMRASDALFLS